MNRRDIPETLLHPLIELNSTLIMQDATEFAVHAESCDVYLDNELVTKPITPSSSRSFPFCCLFAEEIMDLSIRCAGRLLPPPIDFIASHPNWTQPLITRPRSAFSFLYPVVHCTVNATCKENPLLFVPSQCSLTLSDALPSGFELSSSGVLSGEGSQEGRWDLRVGCKEMNYETGLTILIESRVDMDR